MDDRVVNRKPAPACSAPMPVAPGLKVKKAGKITRPDMSATKVSSETMVKVSPRRLRSLSM